MFCNFEQPALILRFCGRGRPVLPQDAGWAALAPKFTLMPGTRQVFLIDVESVQTSCGWGVPFYEWKGQRDQLVRYIEHKPLEEWYESRLEKNAQSIDGLPALRRPDAAE